MEKFIHSLPKAELHLHLEGTLEPELLFQLADKNRIKLPYTSEDELKKAYEFEDLQSFLNLYYAGCSVLQTEEDFYQLTWNYLLKAKEQNIRHCEIFFDPQTHTCRNISFDTIFQGIYQALEEGKKKLNISNALILCFLRHLSEDSAFETLVQALPYRDKIIAVGLDSSEKEHPPEKFINVFQQARHEGFLTVAHAGEEGPTDYIWQAINFLHVKRIDHGVKSIEDPSLIKYLAKHQIPLTLCPLSNIKLKVFTELKQYPIIEFLNHQLCITINSDDPAYFGGYLTENYLAIQNNFNLKQDHLITLAKNSFQASFLSEEKKQFFLKELDEFF